MKQYTVIRNEQDEVDFTNDMMKEMGMTPAEWWLKTDPNNPPFNIGDKVWIESIHCGSLKPHEMKWIREEQTIEEMMPVPCSDSNLWSITLHGIPLMFMPSDLRLA
jgi:hypothetical protein